MFENIGEKIKNLSKLFFWIVTIVCVILAYSSFAAANESNYYGEDVLAGVNMIKGFVLLIGGPLLAWFSSLFFYAFGELVDNSTILAKMFPKELFKRLFKRLRTESNSENVDDCE